MKSLFILFFPFFLLSKNLFSQLNTSKFLVSGRCSIGLTDKKNYSTYGASTEWLIKNKLGVIYNIDYIKRQENFSLHVPMGMTGGPFLIAAGLSNAFDNDTSSKGSFGIIGGLILFILPDGISYHQNIGYRWDIAPYANILGLEFVFDEQRKFDALKYACSFGLKTSYLIKDNLFSFGYVETRKTGGFPWGVGAGIGIGMTFGKNLPPIEIPKKGNDETIKQD
jgi:hypothetical protein